MRALGAYNQGASIFNNEKSWSELITDPETQKSGKLKKAMRSGLDILKNIEKYNGVSSDHGIGLPMRQYIWEGAAEVPENPATPE